jgi:hypothetical protein
MLTISNIIDILEPNQQELDDGIKKKRYVKINDIYDNFYILEYELKIKNEFINFFSSILTVLDKTFFLTEKKFKIEKIKSFINKMIVDYDNQNFYYKYYYNKNKKIRKSLIQTYLYDILNRKKIENIKILQQFIADYFSLNIFILTDEVTDIKFNDTLFAYNFINSNQYENKINKYVPTIILYKNENNYYPVISKESYVLLYSKHKELLSLLYNKFCIFIEGYKYLKKSLTDLRQTATEIKIDIKKKSESSGKSIYLRKNELLDKIRLSYEF